MAQDHLLYKIENAILRNKDGVNGGALLARSGSRDQRFRNWCKSGKAMLYRAVGSTICAEHHYQIHVYLTRRPPSANLDQRNNHLIFSLWLLRSVEKHFLFGF
jgi:hypothetical protein